MKDFLAKILSKIKPLYLAYILILFLAAGVGVYFAQHGLPKVSLRQASRLTFPPNTTIVKATGNFAYQNLTNDFQTQFKETPTATDSIVFKNVLGQISFYTPSKQVFGELKTTLPASPSGSVLLYPNIFPQLDLRYTISSSRLLEEFIVKDAATAKLIPRIDQSAKTDSNFVENKDGSVAFFKNDKKTFTLPHPVMYEMADKTKTSQGIVYEIKDNKTDLSISKVITAEGRAWLADPKRKYPIAIDLVIDNGDTVSTADLSIDNGDTVANWTSSDGTNSPISQDTGVKQEGTGSVKITSTADVAAVTVDLMEYSSDATARAAYVTSGVYSTDGTITTSGLDFIHTFTSSGTFTTSGSGSITYLVVAGGGGGGNTGGGDSGGGGGGGAGGMLTGTASIGAGALSVTVGNGGGQGVNGGDSVLQTVATATGGGHGGNFNTNTATTGGSGGGGGWNNAGKAGTGGQGNSGANGQGNVSPWYGGGGGGAGGAAGTPTGGVGLASSITGGSVTYARGGTAGSDQGPAGSGTGAANTGNGGGGGTCSLAAGGSGAGGGSGIVIVRYSTTLLSYSEPTIKTEGTYALKGYAELTTSLNKTLTRTIGAPLNLSDQPNVTFDIRASRTGSNLKIGLHDTGGTTTEVTPNIAQANVFQSATLDLSGVINANKDAIDQIIITVTNADVANTFYIDNMKANPAATSLGDTITKTTGATDLSTVATLTYWVRSSVTGTFATFGFGEAAASEQTNAITISSANTWEQKTWDISQIAAASRDAVTKFAFTFTGNTSGALFYFDDIRSQNYSNTWVSSNTLYTNVSLDTNIKQEGSGSVKVQTTAQSSTNVDLMEYTSDANALAAYVPQAITTPTNTATGGTITYTDSNGANPRSSPAYAGGYTVHTFTVDGTFTPAQAMNAEVLIVGGGGGGGGIYYSGGGGAGGFLYKPWNPVTAQAYTVTVGGSGAGGVGANGRGTNGGNSAFGALTATGGGGGGAYNTNYTGVSGGSGGGSSGYGAGGASGTSGQGYGGGNGGTYGGGGGGGAGGAGSTGGASNGGAGGPGLASSITGTSVFYAGGGGGAAYTGTGASGGSSIGGNGATYSTGTPTAGATNTGSGGGGSNQTGNGGAGGTGIVIVRYLNSSESTVDTAGSRIHTYKYSSTFTPNGSFNVAALVVAGGGGGGGLYYAGGGGAGGYKYDAAHAVTAQSYAITVGGGGDVGHGANGRGSSGSNSVFDNLTATGGGGGGAYNTNFSGVAGGSGGGSSGYGASAGAGTAGQGNNGGNGGTYGGGGGGGGSAVGAVGGASNGGAGGAGYTNSITGAAVVYAGGGGGAAYTGTGGAGGTGGGGTGATYSTGIPTAGTPNTGGGGGGTNQTDVIVGGNGGSGVVIISEPTPLLVTTEGTNKTQGTYALKVVAAANSLNKTLTRTIGSPLDLSNLNTLTFDIRASRTGSNIKLGFHDAGGTTTEVTPNITQADVYQTATVDLSGVSNANKDAIDQIVITIVNADAVNTFYMDNVLAFSGSSGNTVTRTTAPTDLSGVANITFWVRSSVAGSFASFGFGEAAATEQSTSITINQANTWEQKTWDISGIAAASRNAVTRFAFTFTGNTSGAAFYVDDIQTNALFAPTLGTPTSLSSSSIRWNFTDNSAEEAGYNIIDSSNNAIKAACASTNLTYCDETGLSPNTQYTRKIDTYKLSPAASSTASGTVSGYTLAALPSAPVITSRTGTTALVNITAGTNPAATEYAIYRETGTTCDGSGGVYLADNGSSNGATAVWVTDNNWGLLNDGSGVIATGLNAETAYTFCVKARNANNVETGFGPAGAGDTGYIPLSGDFVNTTTTNASVNKYLWNSNPVNCAGNNSCRYIIGVDKVGANDTNTAVLEMRSGIFSVNANETLVAGTISMTGGSVAIATGGQVKTGAALWALDTDNDGYPANATLSIGAKPSASWKRKAALTTLATLDCNDAVYDLANSSLGTYYADTDGDGYGAGAPVSMCAAAGFVSNNTDCNDADVSISRTISPAKYLDADGDGYGTGSLVSCAPQTGSYTASVANDCGPDTATAYPGSATCSSTSFLNASSQASWDYDCSQSGALNAGTACGTAYYVAASYGYMVKNAQRVCTGNTAYLSGTGAQSACGAAGYTQGTYTCLGSTECQQACAYALNVYGTQACN